MYEEIVDFSPLGCDTSQRGFHPKDAARHFFSPPARVSRRSGPLCELTVCIFVAQAWAAPCSPDYSVDFRIAPLMLLLPKNVPGSLSYMTLAGVCLSEGSWVLIILFGHSL